MNTSALVLAVEKHAKMSKQDAEKAVAAVLGTIRDSGHATMILRAVEGKDSPVESRKKIYLCG